MRKALAAVAVVLAVAACAHAASSTPPPRPAGHHSPPRVTVADDLPDPAIGVVTDDLPAFDVTCGCRPSIAVHAVRWGQPLPARQTALDEARGTVPLYELDPYGVSLSAIADGRADAYLRGVAYSIRKQEDGALVSFAPEANGDWYPWSGQPAAYTAAWRHVVDVFRSMGVTNVLFVWIVNQLWSGSAQLASLWPGAAYVDEVGIDGYFRVPSDTFASVFGPTITAVRKLTGRPVLISETGARPSAGQVRALGQLETGVRGDGLAGFVYFDIDEPGTGPAYGAWALTGSALAAFGEAARNDR